MPRNLTLIVTDGPNLSHTHTYVKLLTQKKAAQSLADTEAPPECRSPLTEAGGGGPRLLPTSFINQGLH